MKSPGTFYKTPLFGTKMKNTFFKIALAQAARIARKPDRMLQLVAQLIHRLYHINISMNEFKEQLQLIGRLIVAYAHGHYRTIPRKTLLVILAALLYFLNPLDLVPDAIVGVGLMDDLAVLTWVYRSAQQELNDFSQWEKSHFAVGL